MLKMQGCLFYEVYNFGDIQVTIEFGRFNVIKNLMISDFDIYKLHQIFDDFCYKNRLSLKYPFQDDQIFDLQGNLILQNGKKINGRI